MVVEVSTIRGLEELDKVEEKVEWHVVRHSFVVWMVLGRPREKCLRIYTESPTRGVDKGRMPPSRRWIRATIGS